MSSPPYSASSSTTTLNAEAVASSDTKDSTSTYHGSLNLDEEKGFAEEGASKKKTAQEGGKGKNGDKYFKKPFHCPNPKCKVEMVGMQKQHDRKRGGEKEDHCLGLLAFEQKDKKGKVKLTVVQTTSEECLCSASRRLLQSMIPDKTRVKHFGKDGAEHHVINETLIGKVVCEQCNCRIGLVQRMCRKVGCEGSEGLKCYLVSYSLGCSRLWSKLRENMLASNLYKGKNGGNIRRGV